MEQQINLVLDLDHTLLQTKILPKGASSTDVIFDRKFTIETEGTRGTNDSNGNYLQVYVKLRPGLEKFLKLVADNFNCSVFTNSHHNYAKGLIDIIDHDGKIFKGNVISRSPDQLKTHLSALLLQEGMSARDLLKLEDSGVISAAVSKGFDVLNDILDQKTLQFFKKIDFGFLDKDHNPTKCEICKMKKIYPCLGDPKRTIVVDNDSVVWGKENLITVEPFYPYVDDPKIPDSLTTLACKEMISTDLSYVLDDYSDTDTLEKLWEKLLKVKTEYQRRKGKVDIPIIIDEMKRKTFDGMTLFIPQKKPNLPNWINQTYVSHGAKVATKFTPEEVTHVITSSFVDLENYCSSKMEKDESSKDRKKPCYVTPLWLIESIKNWGPVDTEPYLVVELEERLIREAKKLERSIEELKEIKAYLENGITKAQKRTNYNKYDFQPQQKRYAIDMDQQTHNQMINYNNF